MNKVITLIVFLIMVVLRPEVLVAGEAAIDYCKDALPRPLKSLVGAKFHQWKIISDELLAGYEENYRKERPKGCPGVASLDLYGNGKRVFAIAILREVKKGVKSKLLLAEQNGSKEWVVKTLWDDECACVVMPVPPGKTRMLPAEIVSREWAKGLFFSNMKHMPSCFDGLGKELNTYTSWTNGLKGGITLATIQKGTENTMHTALCGRARNRLR